jgi:predicted RNA-binding Zn-ribbon protein involved in translation (DUF1610 family)
MALDVDQLREAVRRIAAWRVNADAPVACPACGEAGLMIIDRSARPYAEWYALSCRSCGLDETLHIPLEQDRFRLNHIASNATSRLKRESCSTY